MAIAVETPNTVESAVFVFTGAGTARYKHRPAPVRWLTPLLTVTELAHAGETRRMYEDLDSTVQPAETIVPGLFFGVGPPELIYAVTEVQIDHKLEKHSGENIRFVGHSLGGFIATTYSARHPELNIDVTAIASPFGNVNGIPLSGPLFGRATASLQRAREELGADAPPLRLVGSEGDIFIPVASALPDLPGAERVIFTRNPQNAIQNDLIPVTVEAPPGHCEILHHPAALAIYAGADVRPTLSAI